MPPFRDTLFPITFWAPPPPEIEHYQKMAEGGFTVAQVSAETPQAGRKALDLAHQVGIQAIVWDPRIYRELPERPHWEDVVRAVIHDYADHPALYGYMLADEPHPREFDNLARLVRAFQSLDPDHVPYVNMLPGWVKSEWLGTLDYRQHVQRYMDVIQPTLLSYDHYPLLETGDRPEWFENLEIVRQEALRASVPFWVIILATPHQFYRDPTPAELRWQAFCCLAYGARGLSYWTYWTPDGENHRNGICDYFGYYGSKYEAVRGLNLEILKLAPQLLRLRSTAVYHWPDVPRGAMLLSGKGLVQSIEGGQFVIGEFVDEQGLPWLMVVNRDYQHAARATMVLRTEHIVLSEMAHSTGTLRRFGPDLTCPEPCFSHREGLAVRFWMAPGDGRLFRLGE